MGNAPDHLQLLRELEARHEELFSLLDELDRRVSAALAECRSGWSVETRFEAGASGPTLATPAVESAPARAA